MRAVVWDGRERQRRVSRASYQYKVNRVVVEERERESLGVP